MFDRILIASRGEIAARVARTCRRIGADTVAVHEPGDEAALHVQACDGAAVLARSGRGAYLDVRAIVEAARQYGCAAIHPGYGLYDDLPELARESERAGIAYVGPSSEDLVLFRDRVSVRNAAFDAGLRILAGSERPIRDASELRADLEALGPPLALKPAFGIGEPMPLLTWTGREPIESIVERCEWDHAYYLERLLDRPRHLEVQIAGDGEGHAVIVGDREVSVRKDTRRVICESPAPGIEALRFADAVRSAIWAAAMDFALSVRVRGVCSAHFVLDARGHFHFVGFHPVLTPEHVVHEMCANIDLVEAQILLAAGEPMPPQVLHAQPTGHAVQARVEAAIDPRDGRPFGGRVEDVRWPPGPTGKVRFETGIQAPARVAPDHDPLVATLTTYSATRHEAVLLLDRVVAETRIAPLITNLRLLRRALNHESFRASQYDEGFLDRVAATP